MRILGGMYADSETGLFYNWHRYYDPKTGRYISSDPIGLAGGLNTYTYAYNNPLKYIDPVGWAAYCKYILELEWRLKARGDKIVSYKFQKPIDQTVDPFYDALSNMGPAFYIPIKIPVYQDTELQQQYNVKYLVCFDDCGKQILKRKEGEDPLDKYRELFHGTPYEGHDPIPVFPGQDHPDIHTRWGVW